jgi:nucleoside-diphosphate-sugar epimerase
MDVLLTGAHGRVGTAILDHVGTEYDWTCLDRHDSPERETHVVDVRNRTELDSVVEGHDAIVHLAGNPSVDAPWASVLQNNIVGTYNVLDAAKAADVERFVFASTNHVVAGWEDTRLQELNSGELIFDHTTPRLPDSYYATSKSLGEDLGRYHVETVGTPERFYALRIGGLHDRDHDHPWDNERSRAWWLSRRDCAQLVDRCLSADGLRFGVFYGVSDNARRWCDLEYARQTIGYRPKDDSSDVEPHDR